MSKFERRKDIVQEMVESAADHVGQIARIITGAVVEVTREIGDLVTDGIELRDAARLAAEDEAAEDLAAEDLAADPVVPGDEAAKDAAVVDSVDPPAAQPDHLRD